MRHLFAKFQNLKIRTRLVAYYSTFALITVGTVIYFSYAQVVKSIQTTLENELDVIAELKMDSLDRWVDEQQRNAVFLASLPELRSLSGQLLDPNTSAEKRDTARESITELLTIIVQRTSDFQDIQIIDMNGVVVVSIDPKNTDISQVDQSFFSEGISKTYTQPFYASDLSEGITLTVSTPLFDTSHMRVGVLALHYNMKRVDEIIRKNPGMKDAVNSYLITSDRQVITDDPLLLANFRGLDSFAIQSALSGHEGIESYTNHNGTPVIGKYSWVDKYNAALVVELDREAALWPAQELALRIAVIGTIISNVLVLIVTFMARRIIAPLDALTETVSRIDLGDLTASAPIAADDEVGMLARAFNSMTDKLHQTLEGLQSELQERKVMELALRESEERFRKVFQSSPVAICITTLEEGRLLDANYAYWDLTGYKPEDSIGRDAIELKTWDISEERVTFIRDLKLRKSHFNPDDCFYHTDGTLKQVISFYELIRIGNEDCILAMFYDMSAQKQTMQALQQSEARIRALLNAFPDMVVELTHDGWITLVVPPKGMEKNMPPELFIGKHIQEILPKPVVEQTTLLVRTAIETGQMNMFEFEIDMGGNLRFLESRIVASASNTGLMLIRDITQRKWVEAEREKLINELEVRNEESETLRESLANIVGTFEFSEIIQRILVQIRRVIPYDTASVWKLEADRQYFMGGVDLPPGVNLPGMVFTITEGNSALPIIKGDVPYVLNNNVQAELPDFQVEPHTYVQSWLAIPLKTRGKVTGLIEMDGTQRDQFTEHHATLAVIFANQVAIALENASLFTNLQTELEYRKELIGELKNKNAEAETLRESAAIVAATLEKGEAIERILEQLERVIPFDSASVQLLNENKLQIVSMRGLQLTEDSGETIFELNETEPSYPILCGDAPYVLIHDIQTSFPALFNHPPHDRIHAWMAVPLKVKGRKLGIIALDGKQAGQFTESHAGLAVTYANQVAIALENARLFSELQTELTARKNLIVELENKHVELERFTYAVSHDLKAPLFTVRGFLGYLEQDALSGNHERLAGDIQRITDATEKMNRLLNELLELSRIGRIRNESTLAPFEQIAREAAELVHGRIMAGRIQVHIQPNLPSVYGDYPRLVEVLQNLMDNAAKFMGEQKEPQIEIGQRGEENNDPVFYVRDNGMGIAPEHFERIFGLFNKLNPKTDGTGIGLAMVKRIIEVHGGRVWVESDFGKGTTFFFTLHRDERGTHG